MRLADDLGWISLTFSAFGLLNQVSKCTTGALAPQTKVIATRLHSDSILCPGNVHVKQVFIPSRLANRHHIYM